MTRRRAVFLDRDGVLNRAVVREGRPFPPRNLEEMEIVPDAVEACRNLKKNGFTLLVVTNQPDVARGTQSEKNVHAINEALRRELPIDAIYTCFHDDKDGCDCRKPQPGMLLRAAREWNVDMKNSYMVGDRATDIEAGRAAGVETILVRGEHREPIRTRPHYEVGALRHAAAIAVNDHDR